MTAKRIPQKLKLPLEEKRIDKYSNKRDFATPLKNWDLELMNGPGADVRIWSGLLAG